MKETEASRSYRKAISDSFDLTKIAISELKNNLNNDFKELNYESLNKLQKNLIFDTTKLIKLKNEFKNEVNDSNLKNLLKIKSNDSCIENSFLLKYEIQNYKNNENWNLLNKMLNNLPDLKINDILSIVDDENDGDGDGDGDVDIDNDVNMTENPENVTRLIKSLDIPVESIKKLIWNNETNEMDDFKRDEFLINDTVNEKINSILSNSDVKKFRLVQLHDKYYQRKISLLKESDIKWNSELNKIKSFIRNDINKFKVDLNNRLEIEQKEDDALNSKLGDSVSILDYEEDIDDVEDIDLEGDYDDVVVDDDVDDDADVDDEKGEEEEGENHDDQDEDTKDSEELAQGEENEEREVSESTAEAPTESLKQSQQLGDLQQQDPPAEEGDEAEIEE